MKKKENTLWEQNQTSNINATKILEIHILNIQTYDRSLF